MYSDYPISPKSPNKLLFTDYPISLKSQKKLLDAGWTLYRYTNSSTQILKVDHGRTEIIMHEIRHDTPKKHIKYLIDHTAKARNTFVVNEAGNVHGDSRKQLLEAGYEIIRYYAAKGEVRYLNTDTENGAGGWAIKNKLTPYSTEMTSYLIDLLDDPKTIEL